MYILSRREFLRNATIFSALGVAPQFLTRAAEGAQPAIHGFADDRVLVVVQLSGGNDGLNTIVPYGDDQYYRLRSRIALKKDRLLTLDNHLGFNDSLEDLMRLYDDGMLAVVQSVGYPNPDRSHFRSMEIWQTASDSDEFLSTGWIGRYFDNTCSGSCRPQAGVAISPERPQAFDGDSGLGVAFTDPKRFGWQAGKQGDSMENFEQLNAPGASAESNLDFLRHMTSNAIMSSEQVKEAASRAKGTRDAFSGAMQNNPLATVAKLIRGGLETRIFYVSFGSFDTHANQPGQHERLLGQFAQSMRAFQETLRRDGTAGRVLTMVFSEFGRRVNENASGGTDHGTAGPMFLIGDNVRAGLHGKAPNLSDLQNGDLQHATDFRSVYASVLDQWFGVDPKAVLLDSFPTLDIVA